MFVRLSRYEIPADRVDDAVSSFREALERITELGGFQEGYLLVSPESDSAATITFWDSLAALQASNVAASKLRSEAARAADGGVTSSEDFEVAVHTGSKQAVASASEQH
jgi:heme-degrading monooxygenase HmoA